MFRKAFSFGGLLLLAGAVVLATPGRSQAQRGGGGHGGGGHFGGGHFGGGARFGGAHFGGARFGGTHFGGTHFGGAHLGGFRGFHYGHPYAHYGYRNFYPFYGSYGYYPYYNTYPYAGSSPTYDEGYSYGYTAPDYGDGAAADATYPGSYQAFDSPPALGDTSDNTVHILVKVPANARVWFEGVLTTSTGPVREFQSPPLTSGNRYTYDVRARWNDNGREITQTQRVAVTPGAHVRVEFPTPPGTAAQASTRK